MKVLFPALLVLGACGGPPPPPQRVLGDDAFNPTQGCFIVPVPGGGLIALRAPVEIELALLVDCPRRPPPVDQLEVQVIGPDERPVPATVTPAATVREGHLWRVSTRVGFVPERAGAWTVRAAFEPAVGQVQHVFQAAAPRSDAGHRLVAANSLPPDCVQFGVLASGTPVCLVARDNELSLFVGSTSFRGAAFALDGDAVWFLEETPSDVRTDRAEFRLVRVVAGSSERHQSAPFLSPTGPMLAVRDGKALVVQTSPVVDRLPTSRLATARPGSDGTLSLEVHEIGERSVRGIAGGDGTWVVATVNPRGSGETLVLSDEGRTTVFTHPPTLVMPRSDGQVLWAEHGQQLRGVTPVQALTFFSLARGAPKERTIRFVSSNPPWPGLSPQMPVVQFPTEGGSGLRGVVGLEDGEPRWEWFQTGPGFGPVVSATRQHAFARSLDGKTLKVIDR